MGAGGVVLAGGADQGGDRHLVQPDESHEHIVAAARHEARKHAHAWALDTARPTAPAHVGLAGHRTKRRRQRGGRAPPRSTLRGDARNSSAMMARRRRVTLLRTTAPPTARETAKPAMLFASPVLARYTTAVRVPALAPWRITRRKSSLRRSRWLADSTTPTGRRDPYDDGPSRSHARHGYACAGGSRASWHACGCSAEKSACSRENSTTVRDGQIAHLRYALRARRSNLWATVGALPQTV